MFDCSVRSHRHLMSPDKVAFVLLRAPSTLRKHFRIKPIVHYQDSDRSMCIIGRPGKFSGRWHTIDVVQPPYQTSSCVASALHLNVELRAMRAPRAGQIKTDSVRFCHVAHSSESTDRRTLHVYHDTQGPYRRCRRLLAQKPSKEPLNSAWQR